MDSVVQEGTMIVLYLFWIRYVTVITSATGELHYLF